MSFCGNTKLRDDKQSLKYNAIQIFQKFPKKQQHQRWAKSFRLSNKNQQVRTTNNQILKYSNFNKSIPLESLKNTKQNIQKTITSNVNLIVKNILKSNYENLIQKYQNSNQLFVDPEFPPNQQSLGQKWFNKCQWKRIHQIIPNPIFAQSLIQPSDILQGSLGDCYFLSAIAALAQNDYRIKNIFPNLQMQKNGIYMAKVLYKGVYQQVVVDDYIPVDGNNKPMFAKPSGGIQIWVMILQKCWAKLNGSYAKIEGGLPHQVLHDFSGAPTFYNFMPQTKQNQDLLFLKVLKAQKDGGVLCCGTKSDLSIQEKGLVIGHAYTLLGVYQKPYRMVKIRNPWGQKQWNGRANQKDSQFWGSISVQQKKQLGYQNKNDGVFFMLWEDFVQVFQMIDICMIDDNASYLYIQKTFQNNKGVLFQFQVRQKIEKLNIALSQDNLRNYNQKDKNKGYSRTNLIVSKYEKGTHGYQFIFLKSSEYKLLENHYMQLQNLDEGKYIIYSQCNWIVSGHQKATVSIYGQAKIILKQNNQINVDDFLYNSFINHARRNTKKRKVINQQPLQWICNDFLVGRGGFGYSVCHLDSESKSKIGFQFDQAQYQQKCLQLIGPYKGKGKIKTIANPGQQLIVMFKMDAYNCPISFVIPYPKAIKLL